MEVSLPTIEGSNAKTGMVSQNFTLMVILAGVCENEAG